MGVGSVFFCVNTVNTENTCVFCSTLHFYINGDVTSRSDPVQYCDSNDVAHSDALYPEPTWPEIVFPAPRMKDLTVMWCGYNCPSCRPWTIPLSPANFNGNLSILPCTSTRHFSRLQCLDTICKLSWVVLCCAAKCGAIQCECDPKNVVIFF